MRGPTRYGFFCFPFVFPWFFFVGFSLSFLWSSLDFPTLVKFICVDASAPLTRFLLLRLAPVAKEGPITGVRDSLS